MECGHSLDGFASMCEISKKHLGELERGRGNPSLEVLEKIAQNLNMPVHDLLNADSCKGRDEKVAELISIIQQSDEERLDRVFKVIKALVY
jgi:XRE family aerobic/anaerobic benzoate catabolism transcriptional regulator